MMVDTKLNNLLIVNTVSSDLKRRKTSSTDAGSSINIQVLLIAISQ